jgi:hypothetical protein
MLTINPTKQFTDAVAAALAELDKFTGPEVEALKASARQTIEAAVTASGPIAAQLLNLGLSSIPGVAIFAPAIEVVADPIVSGFVSGEAKQMENDLGGTPTVAPRPQVE